MSNLLTTFSTIDDPSDAALRARRARTDLAWVAARARGLGAVESSALVTAVRNGTLTLDPVSVAAEVEALIGTLRLHAGCVNYVRTYGSANFTNVGPGCCQACARPLGCGSTAGEHTYRELSGEECRARGLYHGGACYHVSVCDGCGHVEAVDSSD